MRKRLGIGFAALILATLFVGATPAKTVAATPAGPIPTWVQTAAPYVSVVSYVAHISPLARSRLGYTLWAKVVTSANHYNRLPLSIRKSSSPLTVQPLAGAHPNCITGSFAQAFWWGFYFKMSECLTQAVLNLGGDVAAIASFFSGIAGLVVVGGAIVVSYAVIIAAVVGVLDALIAFEDWWDCNNQGVAIVYTWSYGTSLGC